MVCFITFNDVLTQNYRVLIVKCRFIMKIINHSMEIFPGDNFSKLLLEKYCVELQNTGTNVLSITFNKRSFNRTLVIALYMIRLGCRVIVHVPITRVSRSSIKILKLSNVYGLLLLRGDGVSITWFSLLKFSRKIYRIAGKNFKCFSAAYPGEHVLEYNSKHGWYNHCYKILQGCEHIITQVELDTVTLKAFYRGVKRSLWFNHVIIHLGVIVLKTIKELEYIFINTNNVITQIDKIILSGVKENNYVIKRFTDKLFCILRLTSNHSDINIHFYTLNRIGYLINLLRLEQ